MLKEIKNMILKLSGLREKPEDVLKRLQLLVEWEVRVSNAYIN